MKVKTTAMLKLSLLLIFTVIVAVTVSFAQPRIIYGHVSVYDSIPIMGADIYIKSSKHTVRTDSLGNFWAKCDTNDKLRATVDGFYKNTIKVTAADKVIHFKMRLKSGDKNYEFAMEHIHTAYIDKMSKIVHQHGVDFSNYDNIYDLIIGRLTGVRYENGVLKMRGTRSVSGSDAALVVVDGIPVDYGTLSTIAPVNVESVSVLSANKAAYFGSEAANGVIVIKTKKMGQ